MAAFLAKYSTEYATPLDASHRIQEDSSEVEQYLTCSEQDSNASEDSSKDNLSERGWRAIGGRSKRTRRTILKAKRRIFHKPAEEVKTEVEKPFVFAPVPTDPHCGRIDGFRRIDGSRKDPMDHVQAWIEKHQEEFERIRREHKPTAMVPPTTVQSCVQQVVPPGPVQPTHQLIWVATLVPVDTTVYPPTYYQRMSPLLVPIGSVNPEAFPHQPINNAGVPNTWTIGSNCQPNPMSTYDGLKQMGQNQMHYLPHSGYVQIN